MAKSGADIKLVSDSLDTIKAISERSPDSALPFRILIEVDSGEGRAGVLADDPVFLEMARVINDASNMKLMGVMTHAGHSYECETVDAIKDVAAQERERITSAAERLRESDLPCPIVSAGSTPTAVHAENLDGVTEMRPGVFVFNDLKQLAVRVRRKFLVGAQRLGATASQTCDSAPAPPSQGNCRAPPSCTVACPTPSQTHSVPMWSDNGMGFKGLFARPLGVNRHA